MKKILFAAIIFCFALNAKGQTADSLLTAAGDSIDIHAMVQRQIDEARRKQSLSLSNLAPQVEMQRDIAVETAEPKSSGANALLVLFSQIPFIYKAYAAISFLIMFFILGKRYVAGFNSKSLRSLKERIGLMREEKIGGSKTDSKLNKSRRVLKSKPEVFNVSEIQLSKAARKMNLSKGELILAARLKFFEVKEMQEV
ncbi:MAG: hypothetical protein M1495_19070 [Bacteroidetes bacterium]|nr:hypothetical protein [Bacteroidota bacterium]